MPGKSFEERVREQLADLKMLPDDEVWNQVQASLQKTRKRKWLALSAALLIFIAIGLLWLLPLHPDNNETVETVQQPKEAIQTNSQKNNTGKDTTAASGRQPVVAGPVLSVEIAETYMPGKEPAHVYPAEKKVTAGKTIREHESRVDKTISEKPHITENKHSAEVHIAEEEKTPVTAPLLSLPVKPTSTESVTDTKTDTAQPATVAPVTADTASPVAAPAVITKKKKKNSSWEWGVSAEIGKSGLSNQTFGSSLANSSTGAPMQPGPGNGTLYPQPEQTAAAAFSLQLHVAKLVSKKSGFKFSLGYDLYQTNIRAGSKMSANLASNGNFTRLGMQDYFYLNTDSFTYRNNYHFVRAGVDVFSTFAVGEKISLRPQIGAGIGLMTGSNGLHYSATDDVLYTNKSLFRRPQWDLSGGLDIGIGKQPAFWFGPRIQYYLTTLSGEANEPGHLYRASFRLTYIFSGKR